jgi:hypothetical protein
VRHDGALGKVVTLSDKRSANLIRIPEALGAILGSEFGYPERFRGLSQSLQANAAMVQNIPRAIFFHNLSKSLYHSVLGGLTPGIKRPGCEANH